MNVSDFKKNDAGLISNKPVITTVIWRYRNSVLVDDNFIPPFIPDAPGAPIPTDLGRLNTESDVKSSWVKLDWDAPENEGGAPILYYKLRLHWWAAREESDNSVTFSEEWQDEQTLGEGTMGILLTGLVAGRTYQFQAAAVNKEGTSDWSQISSAARMGVMPAKAEPKDVNYKSPGAVEIQLLMHSPFPLQFAKVVALSDMNGRSIAVPQQADCTSFEAEDVHKKFRCEPPFLKHLLPAVQDADLDNQMEKKVVVNALISAYDMQGNEIATARITYSHVSCPKYSELLEVSADGTENTYEDKTCEWYGGRQLACEVCRCRAGFQAQGADTVTGNPPDPAFTCTKIPNYCQVPFTFAHGKIETCQEQSTGETSGCEVGDSVFEIKKICDPGYELKNLETTARIVDTIKCMSDSKTQGQFGVLGEPVDFMCDVIEGFCSKTEVDGGWIAATEIKGTQTVECGPADVNFAQGIDLETGGKPSVICAPTDDNSRVFGVFKTLQGTKLQMNSPVVCAGCPPLPLEPRDGTGEHKVLWAPVGRRGELVCQGPYFKVPADFRHKGPICKAEIGSRKQDNLRGKWDWEGRLIPECEESDACKDHDCGRHGECEMKIEQSMTGINKTIPVCECSGKWSGKKCEVAPVMQCNFKLALSGNGGLDGSLSDQNGLARMMKRVATSAIKSYDDYIDNSGDGSRKLSYIMSALQVQPTTLKNVEFCCYKTLVSRGKGASLRSGWHEQRFGPVDLNDLRLPKQESSMEEAILSMMEQAAVKIKAMVQDDKRMKGFLELQSFSADMIVPKGSPPEGACVEI